ncbi:MAG: hypothetical protein GXO36_02570 [Chloroflexi bacterium]|nr:hypothetical protein [Chloroflexota bacterium]
MSTTLHPQDALARMREDPAVIAVRVIVAADACPACLALAGTYDLDDVPALPVEDCSHPEGCRCFYEPVLAEVYP